MSGQLSVEGWNRLKQLEADNERLRRIEQAALFMVRAFTEEDLYDTAEARLRRALSDEGAP